MGSARGFGRFPCGGSAVALALLALLGTTTCARPPVDARAAGAWSYEVTAPTGGSRTVVVEATFDRAATDRVTVPPASVDSVEQMEMRTPAGYRPMPRDGASWVAPECLRRCTVRYRVDLDRLAASGHDEVDVARRVGPATLSPALSWLVHPTPKTDVPVDVHVTTADQAEFASGMHADPSAARTFRFRSFDLDEGSFTAFGPMRRYRVKVASDARARIDLAIVGDAKYAMGDDDVRAWVSDAADVVTPLFGRFPVAQTTLFVVPAQGETEVVFGKVLSLAGASVVLVVGDAMTSDKRRSDWVLVHELFHLGFPTFRGEGRWLGEGLATYYEPILRARAGWTTEAEVYREFSRNLPRGQAGLPEGAADATSAGKGLAQREDLDSIYWGGALFCFAADVHIREASQGQHSLDDVVRGALARGGDATTVWTVADVVRLGDELTGTHVLGTMYERYAAHGGRIDLDGLLASIGVARTGDGIHFDDQKPLAWVRREIVEASRTGDLAARQVPLRRRGQAE